MNHKTVLFLAALAAGPAPASAQDPPAEVTLDQAMALFGRNSPELQVARSRLRGRLGVARQGDAVPNVTASLTHEDLGAYSESYLLLSQPLGFLWEQGRRGTRAEAWTTAALSQFAADSTRLATGVKRVFVQAWARGQAVESLRRAEQVVGDVVSSAEARVAEGDLAGYDLRRLRWERARMARRRAVAELELQEAEWALATAVSGVDEPPRVSSAGLVPDGPPPVSEVDLVARALARRGDLQAAVETVRALEADASLVGTSWLSGTSLTGGGKRQSGGVDGWFLGLQVPLPLSDRRAGARAAAGAAAGRARAETALLERVITRQVNLAEARLASALRQRSLLGEDAVADADQLLRIARLSYEEGEAGIVELLDAAGAFVEARLLHGEVHADSWIAYFELEAAVGGFSPSPPGD